MASSDFIIIAEKDSTIISENDLKRRFLPDEFEVPQKLETDRFMMRMLTIKDLVKDYDAVISSVEHLKGVFGPGSTWPENLTLEQDLIDLGWHQKEFQRGTSFAYTVVTPDESRCLGCVYIDPPSKSDYDAEVYLWVRHSELDNGLDQILCNTVKDWMKNIWPFETVAYPGREISWENWAELK